VAYNNPTSYQKLSLAAQTTYARLVDLLLTAEAGSSVAGASLVSKTIRGHRYWYVQRQEANKRTQAYLGPETPETMAVIERWRRARAEAASRAELVAMARAGGAYVVSAAEARVLEQLSGVFRMGAVLVGSHAFAVLGNLLGVRWHDAIVRTADIDMAHDHRIAVALARDAEPLDLRQVLEDPIPRHSVLNPTDPATSFRVRGAEIEVELLTPNVGRERRRPIKIPALGAAATPLRFLDYLIEETQPGAALGGNGAWVNVPRPGRFAVHKLIVASKRVASSASRPKADKDRAQASALLRVLLDELPGEISLAWKALAKRGRGWTAPAAQSLARLDPDLVAALGRVGVRPD
jgi:hypothetical protein